MVFRDDGHLTDEALTALSQNEAGPGELERLEIAEHLAFCDLCLQRYTALLEDGGALLTPGRSCRGTLWSRIRGRALRLTVNRYATAAAAVALALTVLWSGERADFVRPEPPEDYVSVSRRLTGLTGELNDSLRETVSGFSDFFDGFRPGRFIEGGDNT